MRSVLSVPTFRVFRSIVPCFLFQRSTFQVFCSGVPGFPFQRSTFRRSTFLVLVLPLFTRGSHHRGISVLYLTQNLFPPGKLSHTISLNSHYLVIFRNPRDSKQMFPGRTDYLMESFRDATSRPYGYLVIDCHQLTCENMRLRMNILPGERQVAYVERT